MILAVDRIDSFYGLSHILFEISFSVQEGETVCLLGRNGAGKTTTLRSIMGLTPILSGSIKFEGKEISRMHPFRIARMGIGYVPEGRRIFHGLTVHQNLEATSRGSKNEREQKTDMVYELFPELKKLDSHQGQNLSGGEQQMLAIARALMANPKLLVMDEPSTGLSPIVVKKLGEYIERLRQGKIAILLAEQNIRFVWNVAQRILVLAKGRIPYEGSIEQVRDNKEVLTHYFGV